ARTLPRRRPGGETMKPIAITLGDAAGIGPEIIVQAFRDRPEEMRGCFVTGDAAVLRRAVCWLR
ncbi:hypothetical protein ACQV5M_22450, partial [Leptospira sp. SA-E8]|uniref:hypothetical protein n=1 Tax=Leptospira sp. SA-E8 TaxID=3422259 RepID=UPI003EC117BC